MSLIPRMRPPEPPLNPDKFATTVEALTFIKEHRCSGAAPGEPFLIVTHTIKHRVGEWSTLETEACLGVFADEGPFFMAVGDRLWVTASRNVHMVPGASLMSGRFFIAYRRFEHTPLKEPFRSVPGSRDDLRRLFDAFTLAVGLPAIEELVLAERGRVEGIGAWYLRAARMLFLPTVSSSMQQEADGVAHVLLDGLLAEHERVRDLREHIEQVERTRGATDMDGGRVVIEDTLDARFVSLSARERLSGANKKIQARLAFGHELGLDEREETVAIRGVRYI